MNGTVEREQFSFYTVGSVGDDKCWNFFKNFPPMLTTFCWCIIHHRVRVSGTQLTKKWLRLQEDDLLERLRVCRMLEIAKVYCDDVAARTKISLFNPASSEILKKGIPLKIIQKREKRQLATEPNRNKQEWELQQAPPTTSTPSSRTKRKVPLIQPPRALSLLPPNFNGGSACLQN